MRAIGARNMKRHGDEVYYNCFPVMTSPSKTLSAALVQYFAKHLGHTAPTNSPHTPKIKSPRRGMVDMSNMTGIAVPEEKHQMEFPVEEGFWGSCLLGV